MYILLFQKFMLMGRIQDFPWGGGGGPPMQALFGENVCENKRIWSNKGGVCWKILYVHPPLVK